MKFQVAIGLLVGMFASVEGHGHLSVPRSRTQVAFENGQEYCPACVLENVPAVANGRPYPGARPMAEPGKSVMTMGPCGERSNNNFNSNQKSWGSVVETFSNGQVIDFESCWSADHKGVYSMRICTDPSIVAPFLVRGGNPSRSQENNLEACFKRGILPCDAVGSNSRCQASSNTGCQAGWGCWGNTDWFHTPRSGAQNNGQCGASGSFYTKDQVRLPAGFTSNHTLLSWRWDVMDTAQVYGSCVDVAIR
jgi:hypothetical protein